MDVLFGDEARTSLLKGVDKVCRAVSRTLGPKGANVIINTVNKPIITNDGVTIASHIELDDEIENIGCSLIKEVATKTNDLVGDGTTTSIILADSILKDGLDLVKEGLNPITIKNSITEALKDALDFMKSKSIKEIDLNTIYNISLISSGSSEVASIIKDAFSKVSSNGTILLTDSKTNKTKLNIIEGMNLESGYTYESMISDNKNEEVLENVKVIVTNEHVSSLGDIEVNSLTLIICDDYDESVLEEIKNFNNQLYIIKAPLYGEKRREILKDIEYFTNGFVSKVVLRKDNTILIGGNSNNSIQDRIHYLEEKIKDENYNFELEILEKRLANLKGLVAFIKVGAATELESLEYKMHIEDALNASKSVSINGYLPGGGVSYLECSKYLETKKGIGYQILANAFKKPLYYILSNAGFDYEEVIGKITDRYGFDASNGTYTDVIDSGIIDSTEVVLKAIENSVSVANLLITTDAIVLSKIDTKIDLDNVI